MSDVVLHTRINVSFQKELNSGFYANEVQTSLSTLQFLFLSAENFPTDILPCNFIKISPQ